MEGKVRSLDSGLHCSWPRQSLEPRTYQSRKGEGRKEYVCVVNILNDFTYD